MEHVKDDLQVVRAPGELHPRSFQWLGRRVRVQYIIGVRTRGAERRCRVQTADGAYELGWNTATGKWRMCHSPSLLSRAWAEMRRLPRFPLPLRQQRTLCAQPVAVRAAGGSRQKGGEHAQRAALVR